ncbi:MAG: hypothetical protein V8Q88_00420 [Christensenellales bacterium]
MKVKFTEEMERVVTVAELPAAHKVIEAEKENGKWTAQEWAKMAAEIACPRSSVRYWKLVPKSRRTAACGTHTLTVRPVRRMDQVYCVQGQLCDGRCFLSNLWATSSDNREETIRHMYIRRFKELR